MDLPREQRLQRGRVLTELGWIAEAEAEVVQLLDEAPDNLDALGLFAKLKHIKGELSQAIACWAQLHARSSLAGRTPDHDRMFALAQFYDHVGTPDALAGAANICRYALGDLEARGVERLSLLSRIASFERRAGRDSDAARLDAQFLANVRRRMHRPTLRDLVEVAAREYLPIDELRRVRTPGMADGDRAPLTRRELALFEALVGDVTRARMLFGDGGEPLDRQYLAELAALAGDEARAIELALPTLVQTGDSLLLGWVLDRSSPALDAYWAEPAHRAHAFAILERSLAIAPHRAQTWKRLSRLHAFAGNLDEAARYEARATALAAAETAREAPIGRVLAAGVYHFGGKPKGLLHEIWVHREPTTPGRGGTLADIDIHGNITAELRAAIRNAFVAVREYARSKFPHATGDIADWTYSYKLPKEDEPSGGLSAGLPTALAFLSTFLQRPVSRTIASSGALVTEAHDVITIGRIGEADFKVKAAFHGNLRSLILPTSNRSDVETSVHVPLQIAHEIVQYAGDLDHAVRLVFGNDAFTRL
ncbi:MAG TPA: S16 family serine protease [Kofleriaceae bacterium]|nr:S16 family serine protease [Kofleriaceae bacterium]